MTLPPDPNIQQPPAGSMPPLEVYPTPASAADYPAAQPGIVAPAGMYFDQASGLLLPDGTVLASGGRRIGAYFLSILLAIVTLGIGYLVWGLILWGKGQTPALQVLGMRCWRPEDGRVPGFWWMALREIIGRLVDGILSVITLAVSFILMLTRADRRCLHDIIAGTVVLYDPQKTLYR